VIPFEGFWNKLLAALVAGIVCAETAQAQTPPATNDPAPAATAQVSFHQDRIGLPVPHFTITVQEDGRGAYHGELATTTPAGGRPQTGDASDVPAPAPPIDRPITISPATTARIFELARAADHFRVECAAKMKNIADTGAKTLKYTGSDGNGQCEYNYTEVKPVIALTDIFLTTATTIEMGRKLDFKRRFDRLGLDAEMITLANLLDAHQASEVGTIAPTLRAIADDTELMQRVRLRAAKLLEQTGQSHP
jgi:hypothetical protein